MSFAYGSVIPCCAGNEANRREFQIKTRMGNILEQDFNAIWNGERFKKLRDMLHRGVVPLPCVDCPVYELPVSACRPEVKIPVIGVQSQQKAGIQELKTNAESRKTPASKS